MDIQRENKQNFYSHFSYLQQLSVYAYLQFFLWRQYARVFKYMNGICQINSSDYQYKSLWQGIRNIQQKEGFMRLYKASKVYFACKVLYMSIQMQCFQTIRYYTNGSLLSTIINTIVSTTIATTLLNPLQVLLTRYSLVDTTKKKLVFHLMVKRIYKREGLAGFYKGYPVQVLLHSMYSLFWLPCYDFCRSYYGVEISQ